LLMEIIDTVDLFHRWMSSPRRALPGEEKNKKAARRRLS